MNEKNSRYHTDRIYLAVADLSITKQKQENQRTIHDPTAKIK